MSRIPRLSAKEKIVLELLIRHGEMYGLELVKASSEIKRGAVYVMLGRMEDKGFVTSRRCEQECLPGKKRPRYSITGLGKKAFDFYTQAENEFAEWKGAFA